MNVRVKYECVKVEHYLMCAWWLSMPGWVCPGGAGRGRLPSVCEDLVEMGGWCVERLSSTPVGSSPPHTVSRGQMCTASSYITFLTPNAPCRCSALNIFLKIHLVTAPKNDHDQEIHPSPKFQQQRKIDNWCWSTGPTTRSWYIHSTANG